MSVNSIVVHVIGGGLAGSEAAYQCLRAGLRVVLHEMRPVKLTPAHQTGNLAELVCSNSLKAMSVDTAPGLLKHEMRAFSSLVMEAAEAARVPAGMALAVEREVFSRFITERLHSFPGFALATEEVTRIPSAAELAAENAYWIVATGPLTGESLAAELQRLSGEHARLFFYDAIAPVIEADSIDMAKVFRQSRYEEGVDGDYLNLPLEKDAYNAFIDAVIAAEKAPLHKFEETKYFESCLPIEVMIERGRETLRFGPMKPVGLVDPATGRRPWANVQLRMENKAGTMYSVVGFQTKMKWPEQQRVFRMLPGLENAEFYRLGSVHRNTYLESPKVLNRDLSFRANERVHVAGQVSGVEGYTESASMGLLAGRLVAAKARGQEFMIPPKATMMGALHAYITEGCAGPFQPMNTNLGLLPPIARQRGVGKPERKAKQCETARQLFADYWDAQEKTLS